MVRTTVADVIRSDSCSLQVTRSPEVIAERQSAVWGPHPVADGGRYRLRHRLSVLSFRFSLLNILYTSGRLCASVYYKSTPRLTRKHMKHSSQQKLELTSGSTPTMRFSEPATFRDTRQGRHQEIVWMSERSEPPYLT